MGPVVFSFHESNNSLRSSFKPDPWNDVSVHVQRLGFGSCSQPLGWDGGAEGSGVSLGLEKGVTHQTVSSGSPRHTGTHSAVSARG